MVTDPHLSIKIHFLMMFSIELLVNTTNVYSKFMALDIHCSHGKGHLRWTPNHLQIK
jgi:hypothetical protein